jgi:hypothetical protein
VQEKNMNYLLILSLPLLMGYAQTRDQVSLSYDLKSNIGQSPDAEKVPVKGNLTANRMNSELTTLKHNIQSSQTEIATVNTSSTLSEEQKTQYQIMNLAGGYFQVLDQKNEKDRVEQALLIENTRLESSNLKHEKRTPSFTSKTLESQKVFGNSHIEAALSIVRVHSKYFLTKLPGVKFVGWGGRFMDKINRIEMLYAVDKMPITGELFAMLLFSVLEDINSHEERFGPYLAMFPLSSEDYELRLMLPDYRTQSTREDPKPAFIFNIGDTIFSCHREIGSGSLKVFKKQQFGDIIEQLKRELPKKK